MICSSAPRRAARGMAAAVAVSAAVLAMAGCGSGGPSGQAAGVHTTAARTPASVVPTTTAPTHTAPPDHGEGVPDSAFARRPPFTGPAVDKWGQQACQAAYKEAVNFTFEEGWDPIAMRDMRKTNLAQYTDAMSYMTPSAKKGFAREIAQAGKGDQHAGDLVEAVRYTGVYGHNGAAVLPGPGAVTNRTFTSAIISIDTYQGYARLYIPFTAKADVHMADRTGKLMTFHTTRKMQFWMVKNTGSDATSRPWLVDGLAAWQTAKQTAS